MTTTVAITGASGYLGRALLKRLEQDPTVDRILALDRVSPKSNSPKTTSLTHDITAPGLTELCKQHEVTHIAHLAFRLAPNHDRRGTREVNVGGTMRMLEAARLPSVQQIVFASSSVVYGADRNHPQRIDEDHPLRGTRQVQYTLDKIEAEAACRAFRTEQSDKHLSIMRVVTITGPGMNNFISRNLDRPVLVAPRGIDPPWQFVHEEDCAEAFHLALFAERSGTYNIAADDSVPFSWVLAQTGKRIAHVPRLIMKTVTNLAWYLRLRQLTEIPGALIDFMCYVPVLDNRRAKDELGWQPKYDSRSAISTYLQSQFGRPSGEGEVLESNASATAKDEGTEKTCHESVNC